MKNIICILILVAVDTVICVPTAYAGYNIGLGYTMLDTPETDHTILMLSGGFEFNEYLGVEARMGMSPSTEYYGDLKTEIDSVWGVYFTAAWPIDDSLDVYVIGGHSEIDFSYTYLDYSKSETEDSTSYGFGARYSARKAYDFSVELMEVNSDVRTINFGIKGKF